MHTTSTLGSPKKAARKHRKNGFALVITLSLMILLTVVAVGLLTLSSVALRSTSHGNAMAAARANARLALMMAVGDLQKQLGPDTRVSVTADQIPASADGNESAAPLNRRHWAGAYQAWPAGEPQDKRPDPKFLQWLVSGDPQQINAKDFATAEASGNNVDIVSSGSVGRGDPVSVPLVSEILANGSTNRYGWWVSDEGMKALIAPAKSKENATVASVREDLQSVPSPSLQNAEFNNNKPFSDIIGDEPSLASIASWKSAELLEASGGASLPRDTKGLFHDLTVNSRGLITNVRSGGFRKDLSMEFASTKVPDARRTALYQAGNDFGINFQELWAYYNLGTSISGSSGVSYATSNIRYTTGNGTIPRNAPYLKLNGGPKECQDDDYFFFKQPVVISYDLVVSLAILPGTTDATKSEKFVNIVTDPIITFWNPLDIPVVIPNGVPLTVKYWQIPYSLMIDVGGTTYEAPMAALHKTGVGWDGNYLSLTVGKLKQIVLRPGEVLKTSQYKNLTAVSSSEAHQLDGIEGFNYGKGVAWQAIDKTTKAPIKATGAVRCLGATPNDLTCGETDQDGKVLDGGYRHSRHYSLTHHEYYVGLDRGATRDSLGIGGIALDYDFGAKRLQIGDVRKNETDTNNKGNKDSGDRYNALNHPDVFPTFTTIIGVPASGDKIPILHTSFHVKTETNNFESTRCLSRFNPRALQVDFYDLKPLERQSLPYIFAVKEMGSWRNATDALEQDDSGRAFFGAAMNAADGSNFVITHSIPREPIVSLAALQHSFANGFNMLTPLASYATINAREPLLPQISHAIGNSLACPLLGQSQTTGELEGGDRPIADHSYLANQGLWDDYFFSGIAPHNTRNYSPRLDQKKVAQAFFSSDPDGKLPVNRYVPNLLGEDSDAVVGKYFTGTRPSAIATDEIASNIICEGMFNVNSTSIEAWKCLLGSTKNRSTVVISSEGEESISDADASAAVAGLLTARDLSSDGKPQSLNSPEQWTGRRHLSDGEIDSLARGIVREIRKRGPFISLADFVNRRVGDDKELARSGAIQSALDSNDVGINSAFSGSRLATGGSEFSFQEAEVGPLSYGAPAIVKQADILTPIAPILSARSDSFLVRGYGETTDTGGNVIARAWCEAVVQRGAEFVDPSDEPTTPYASINSTNKQFGRRFVIVSFRWLDPSEV